jgi:hypothetical protein
LGRDKFLAVAKPDGKLDMPSFLAACDDVVKIVDKLGAFLSTVRGDINGNITKCRAAMAKSEGVALLEDLCGKEMEGGIQKSEGTVCLSLLWLKRALAMIIGMVANLADPSYADKKLSVCVQDSYKNTLAPFHGWIVSTAVSTAMGMAPTRETFNKSLANGASDEQIQADMKEFAAASEPLIAHIQTYFDANGLDY